MSNGEDLPQESKQAPMPEMEPKADELWVAPAPGLPKGAYQPGKALEDIPAITYALHVFLRSHMHESEDYCREYDPKMERLYVATGFGLIQCVKGLMSFEDEDLVDALAKVRHGNGIASQHRKRAASLPTRLAGLVMGSLNTSGVGFIKSMTPVERHAELVYAESMFEKALLGIVYSGDWLAFIKEALNMRTTINIYRQLGKYLEAVDAEAQAQGKGPEDMSVDADFRSGVYLGVGLSNLVLSLMPARLLTIVELFGYKGDRHAGLAYLQRAGGWTANSDVPSVDLAREGVRRTICDMSLLIFHLVLSNLTFEGVDISMAQKILDYHIERYPNGAYAPPPPELPLRIGRLHLVRSQPSAAIEYYEKAMKAQNQYRNLHHISFWEMAIANLSLWDVPASLEHWRTLATESTWSKSTYTYGVAVCLLQIGGEKHAVEVAELMEKVPALRQRIAGKSLPIEKFIARKARKFKQQGGRLALPALELLYLFLGMAHAPRSVVHKRMLPLVDEQLAELAKHARDPAGYGLGAASRDTRGQGADEFWDDMCLAQFLRGICLRYLAYPDPDALLDPGEEAEVQARRAESEKGAKEAFEAVFRDGPRVVYDHYLVYYAHFEYARLLACMGDKDGARTHLDMASLWRSLPVRERREDTDERDSLLTGGVIGQGKFSMESQVHVRAHAALEALDRNGRL
ncbi:hypothetical protein GSI_12111 [Ganoderma sinense ZZ0214-1]|uniref:Uncharacterized protein n=1 Tax=Ganoderma sinense ZZ0214-1 TaxID=1077348 RepID=A0A2G8RXW6_9APHY|nr:hypothetical protein GSI_12111 [Ganoderma sinense ZZ0214-1]